MKDVKIGFLYAIVASLLYGIMSVLVKLAVEVPPSTLLFFRNFVGVLILTPMILRNRKQYKVKQKKLVFFNIILSFVHLACFFYAAKHLLFVVDAVTLTNTGNLFVPIVIYFWYKIGISKMQFFSISIGFLGVVMILQPSFDYCNVAAFLGLLSGVVLAIFKVILRKLSKTELTNVIVYYFLLGNAIIAFIPMIYNWKMFANPIMWIYIFLISILTVLFQIFQTKAYAVTSATRISIVFYSTVLFTALFEWIIYMRMPSISSILGAVLIITGGILVFEDKKKMIQKIET